MPAFTYTIRTADSRMEKGEVQAFNRDEALQKVHKLNGQVLELEEAKASGGMKIRIPKRVSLKDRIVLTEQLSVMIKAGITLVQALRGLQEETANRNLAAVLGSLVADVEGGAPFSEALTKHPRVFSKIYCQMVASAEKTGNLSDILSKLTVQQQKEYELKGKVKGALIYPAVVFVLLISVCILVITFILPRLSGLFMDTGAALPWSTKFLLSISNLLTTKWYLIIGVLAMAMAALKAILRTERGLYAWDMIIIKVPIIGNFVRKSYIARFAQSFSSLAQAGVPVLEIFKTLRGVIGNSVYAKEIDKIASEVENGIKVSTAIRKSKYFPGMVGQLVSVGEQSGDLAGIFVVLGDFFEKEVDSMARNLSTLLEPIIMVVMGAAIGFVLISVLQPIFNLSNAI